MKINQIIKESDIHTKREFNSLNMENELGPEDKPKNKIQFTPNQKTPKLVGMYFYDIPPEKESTAIALGVKKTKSGKWALTQYDTSGDWFSGKKRKADAFLGKGKWWEPSKSHKSSTTEQNLDELSLGDVGRGVAKVAKGTANTLGAVGGGAVGAWDALKHGFQVGRGAVGGAGAPVNAQQAAQRSASMAAQNQPADTQQARFAQADAGNATPVQNTQQVPQQSNPQQVPQQSNPQQAAQEKLNAKKVMSLIGTLNKNQQKSVMNQLSKLISQQPAPTAAAPAGKANLKVAQKSPVSRPQGGGKVPGQVSQTPGAVAKRNARSTSQQAAESFPFESKFLGRMI